MYKPVHLKVLTKYWQHCGNRLFSDPCGADREWGTTIVIGYSAVLWINLLPVLSNQMFSGCQPHTQFLEGGGNVCQYWDWKARVRDASINCKELVGFFYAWLLTVSHLQGLDQQYENPYQFWVFCGKANAARTWKKSEDGGWYKYQSTLPILWLK